MHTCQSEGVVLASRVLELPPCGPRLASMLTRSEVSLPSPLPHSSCQHPQLVWDGSGLRSNGQISSRVSGSRNEDWYGGSRECGHILSVMLSFSWWRQCWGPPPSSTRCDNNGTAGFGVLQAEKPHFSTWQKAGEGVGM